MIVEGLCVGGVVVWWCGGVVVCWNVEAYKKRGLRMLVLSPLRGYLADLNSFLISSSQSK